MNSKKIIKLLIVFAILLFFACEKEEESSIKVTGVELNETSISITEGEVATLVASISPSDATNKQIQWESDDITVATVDSDGTVTAVMAGSATITVTTIDGNKTASCSVTVLADVTPVVGVTLDQSNLELNEDESGTLIATVDPSDATNKNLSWESSDEAVATVDSDGKVTAVSGGSAIITVTTEDGNKTASCMVSVISKQSFVDSRDNNRYKFAVIGNQTWMTENLRYLPSVVDSSVGSDSAAYYYVFDYSGTDVAEAKETTNYQKWGVLYNWDAAMGGALATSANPSGIKGICPDGWHLPSDAEFTQLFNYLAENGHNYDGTTGDGMAKIGKSLASDSGWAESGTAGAVGNTDYPEFRNKSGFNALAGGRRNSNGSFDSGGYISFWRVASEWNFSNAKYMVLHQDLTRVALDPSTRGMGAYVRCVKD